MRDGVKPGGMLACHRANTQRPTTIHYAHLESPGNLTPLVFGLWEEVPDRRREKSLISSGSYLVKKKKKKFGLV